MQRAAGLDTGLLVGGEHEFIRLQVLALPLALVQIQNQPGFGGEIRIRGDDPATMLPGPNRVLVEPAPERGCAEPLDQTCLADVSGEFLHAPARQRDVVGGRQFAGKSFNLHDQFWEGKDRGRPGRKRSSNPRRR